MNFKVSVIIPTLNRPEMLKKCVESLDGQANIHELLVIEDDPKNPLGCEQVRQKGVMQTSKESTHIYFTDDDCIVEEGCLERLCDPTIWNSGKVGATGGACVRMNEPHFYQKIWQYQVEPMTIDNDGRICDLSAYYVQDSKWYLADHLRGGNMLVSKQAFNEAGGMSKEFGAGTMRGETDLCMKMRELGYKLYFNGSARVLHYKKSYTISNIEKSSDEFWRKKWAPKRFLGYVRPVNFAPAIAIDLHIIR